MLGICIRWGVAFSLFVAFGVSAQSDYHGPAIDFISDVDAVPGQEVLVPVQAYDVDDHAPASVYTIDHPDWQYDANRKAFVWMPTEEQALTQQLRIQANADSSNGGTQYFWVDFGQPNYHPEIQLVDPPSVLNVGQLFQYQIVGNDHNENDTLSYGIYRGPVGMTIDAHSGDIQWTPQYGDLLDRNVVLTVQDHNGASAKKVIRLESAKGYYFPELNPVPVLHTPVDEPFTYPLTLVSNGSELGAKFSISASPDGMLLDEKTGLIQWVPSTIQEGHHRLYVEVENEFGTSGRFISIVVGEAGSSAAPAVEGQVLGEIPSGQLFQFQVSTVALTGNTVFTYEMLDGPIDAQLDAQGLFSWTPTAEQSGVHPFSVRVTDSAGNSSEQSFVVYVDEGNFIPELHTKSLPPYEPGQPYSVQVVASDKNQSDHLRYTFTRMPSGASIDRYTGMITWNPDSSIRGEQAFSVKVTDQHKAQMVQSFYVYLEHPNAPPRILPSTMPALTEGVPFSHQFDVIDLDQSDEIFYEVHNASAGMSIDGSGFFTWTPTSAQLGWHRFKLVVYNRYPFDQKDYRYFYVNVEEGDTSTNTQPVFTSTPTTHAEPLLPYHYQATAIDADGDPLTYVLVSGPAGMDVDASGFVSWIPTVQDSGTHGVEIRVDDGQGGSATQVFPINVVVTQENALPIITSAPVMDATVTVSYNYQVVTEDVDGDVVAYSLLNAPNGMVIDGETGLITWLPTSNQQGDHSVAISVDDGRGGFANQAYTVTAVMPNNNPEILSSPIVTGAVGEVYAYAVLAQDSDDDVLAYALVNSPSGMTIDPVTGEISWTPDPDQTGEHTITIVVTDGEDGSANQTYTLTIVQPNRAPTITSQPITSINENASYRYNIVADDQDGDTLTYSLIAAPQGMAIDAVSGLVTWSPEATHVGDHLIEIEVTDADGLFDTQVYTLSVINVNDAPVAGTVAVQTDEDTGVALTLIGIDQDGDALFYDIVTQPANGALIGSAPNLLYMPTGDFNGVDTFVYRVNDGVIMSDTATVTITVNPVNDAPSANDQAVITQEDTVIAITLTGNDPDNQILAYNLASQPASGQLNGSGFEYTYTPSENFNGVDHFTFTTSDGALTSDVAAVSILVNAVNDAPIAQDGSVVTDINQPEVAELTAIDHDGDALVFSIIEQPENGTVSLQDTLATYTPNTDFVGSDHFTFVANDGAADSNVSTVLVTVRGPNTPPEITSTPVLVGSEGARYGYHVKAIDAENQALTFDLTNAPTGMHINRATGLLEWDTPVLGDYPIMITVADERGDIDQQSYTLVVTPALPPVTSQGTDFWFMYNSNDRNLGATQLLYIASQVDSHVTVEIPGLAFSEEYDAIGNQVLTIDLSEQFSVSLQTVGVRNFGVHVTSDQPVSAYFIHQISYTTDASIIYPTHALGTAYYIATFDQEVNSQGALMGIVAPEDDTTITITPSVDYSDGVQRERGEAYQITLNRGESYQAMAQKSYDALGARKPFDISGTRILADKPVVVLAGNKCTSVQPYSACDHLISQMAPLDSLGSTYYTMPLASRNGDTIRVYAIEDDTFVRVNDDIAYYLNEGEYYTTILNEPAVITANRPIQTIQFSNSSDYDGVIADPFMMAAPPAEQFISAYVVTTPAEGFSSHYLNVIAPSSAANTVRIDGSPVDISLWQAIPNTDFVGAQIPISSGQHTATADQPFGLYVYGFGNYDSYGYLGGMAFPGQQSASNIALSVDDEAPSVGSTVCLEAALTDHLSIPITQSQVRFLVNNSQPNLNKGFTALTNTLGVAEFCYARGLMTSDQITAHADGVEASITIDWQAYTGLENLPPVIESMPALRVVQGHAYSYQVIAADPNEDALTYSILSGPSGLVVDPDTGLLTWTVPPYLEIGDLFPVSLAVADPDGLVASQSFNLIGTLPPLPPSIVFPDMDIGTQGSRFISWLSATDRNQPETLTWSIAESDGTATINPETGFLTWQADVTNPGAITDPNPYCRAPGGALEALETNTKWTVSNLSYLKPLVGPLYDSNGDGVLDNQDRKFIVGTNYQGYIAAFDAANGDEVWRRTDIAANRTSSGTLIDLDDDQSAEFLFIEYSTGRVVALDSDGETRWISEEPIAYTSGYSSIIDNDIRPVDLNQDGIYEIVAGPAVYDAQGVLLWRFPVPDNRVSTALGGSVAVVDIDLDGSPEILYYDQVRDAQGVLLWTIPNPSNLTLRTTRFAHGNFDQDPEQEIVVRERNSAGHWLKLIDHDGALIWQTQTVNRMGRVLVADLDRGGYPEIYLSGIHTKYDANGNAIWAPKGTAQDVGASIADIDADGQLDILRYDPTNYYLYVYDGASGLLSHTIWNRSNNISTSAPLFIDIDNDGQGEIVAGGSELSVYEARQSNWLPAMPNYAYPNQSIGEVDESLRLNSSFVSPSVGQTGEVAPTALPSGRMADLVVASVFAHPLDGGNYRIGVNMVNRGILASPDGLLVALYKDDPLVVDNRIGEIPLPALNAGEQVQVEYTDAVDAATLGSQIFAVLENTENFEECETANNIASARTIGITVTDSTGLADTDYWRIGVVERSTGPVATSRPIYNATVGELYQYQLVAEDSNATDVLRYYLDNAPKGASIDAVTGLVSWTPSADQVGRQRIDVVPVDLHYNTYPQVFWVTVAASEVPNTPPEITSQPVIGASVNLPYRYDVHAHDPDGGHVSYALTSAPTGMTINALSGQIKWLPGTSDIGSVPVVVTVTDEVGAAVEQTFSVSVIVNTAPQITSEPGLTARLNLPYTYQIEAIDADGDALTYSLINAPVGMTLSSDGLLSWTPTTVETVPVRVRISDGSAFVEQRWSITSTNDALSGLIDVNPTIVDPNEPVTIQVFPQNGMAPISISATLDGSPLTLDANYQAQITATGPGGHVVEATITDQYDSVVVSGTYTVRDPNDIAAPVVSLSAPLDNAVITAPVDIIGTVSDTNLAHWRLDYISINTLDVVTLAEGTTNVTDQALATFDPTLLLNGQYEILLTGTDINGQTAQVVKPITVDGDLKIGHFSFTVEDLAVPLAGLPIRVTRTYDSRRKDEALDFGYGWTVGYQDARVEESRDPGLGWELNEYPSGPLGLVPLYCVEPMRPAPVVSVTLPTGEVERFEVAASPKCNQSAPLLDVELAFTAVGDNQSTLEALDDQSGRLVNSELVDVSSLDTLNPSRYRLTTRSGYVYTLDESFGIETVKDPNGNTLTYSDSGIVHSSGKSVAFERDAQGRIEAIIDPKGNRLEYGYDTQGDLRTVEDQVMLATPEEDAWEYTYTDHYLEDMLDPLGRRILKNLYDENGRLYAQEDSNGVQKLFDHDLSTNTSVVTDRDGRSVRFSYDDEGNVLTETQLIYDGSYSGDITTVSTYDTNGNQETRTIGLSTWTKDYNAENDLLWAEDPEGNRVNYLTYNQFGQETEIQDEMGRITEMGYDAAGNLESIVLPPVIDPDTGTPIQYSASNVINARGLVESTTDLRGLTTTYTYYPVGHQWEDQKWTESTPESGTISFTYDDNLNVKSQTRERTVDGAVVLETEEYEYDTRNRLVRTNYPDGTYTETAYDLAGNVDRERDRFGQWTDYTYDAYGRLTYTLYPDGSEEIRTYSNEGLLETVTDRMGRTTTNVYDDAGRLWKTEFDDGTYTETRYTLQGWVKYQWDEKRNLTEYEYDLSGKRTDVVRYLVGVPVRHEYTYYDNGELHTETDANLHTTTYGINELDQRIETRFHNGTTIQQRYDAMGARVRQTDQRGVAKDYRYDSLGRLEEVQPDVIIDSQRVPNTIYTYDEVGNKLTQTDANGHTTSWTYDYFGRVLTRQLPLGQTESFVYDDAARTVTHTDFNGDYSVTQNDVMGRVESVSYFFADGTPRATESYTYYDNSQIHTVTDKNGTTEYGYDSRDRLAWLIQPDGVRFDYDYDDVGNQTQVKVTRDEEVTVVDYTYDDLNRLETVIDANGTTTYTYYDNGNLRTVTYPNGVRTEYQYNAVNQLEVLTTRNSANEIISQYTYGLDNTGRRETITEQNGRFTQYGYDDLYRLTSENITDATNGDYSASYQYDWVGNRVYETVNGIDTAYQYDDNDRLEQQGGTVFTYDDNGNTLTETLDSVVTEYSYDEKNKLTSVTKGSVITDYTYNHNGIRTSKSESGITTDFIVDENLEYAQVLQEVENDSVQVYYTYGHDLINQERAGVESYYLYDGLGSTRALSSGEGAITDTYFYEAFGEVLAETGDTENDYKYTGEQYDSSLDMTYLRARYYDQGIGRFSQMDTWAGVNAQPITLNKYLYANADPVLNVDPTGNFSLASVSAAMNVASVLTNMQVQSGFSLLDGAFGVTGNTEAQGDLRTSQMILGVAQLGAGGFQLLKMLSGKFRAATSGMKCNSFEAGTIVHSEFGSKKIQDLQIGDKVWAYNEATGEKSLQKIVHLIRGEGDKEVVDITLTSGEVIHSTGEHPFFVLGHLNDWVDANKLQKNNELFGIDGSIYKVKSINTYTKNTKVYNLTIDNDHTYYVGEDGVLSHNAGCEPKWDWHHVFNGSRGGGVHHIGSVGSNFIVGKKGKTAGDFYEAELWRKTPTGLKPKKGGGMSTFFPDNMTQQQVKSMMWAAALKSGFKSGSMVPVHTIWPGTPKNVFIKVREGKSGWIGHPIIK